MRRYFFWTPGVACCAMPIAPAAADELSARSAEVLYTGASILDDAVPANAWETSLPIPSDPDMDVLARSGPDCDAQGLDLGGWRLLPAFNVGGGYTDNVFFSPTRRSDAFYQVAPEILLQPKWSHDSLTLYGGLNYQGYKRYTSENVADANTGLAVLRHLTDDSECG